MEEHNETLQQYLHEVAEWHEDKAAHPQGVRGICWDLRLSGITVREAIMARRIKFISNR